MLKKGVPDTGPEVRRSWSTGQVDLAGLQELSPAAENNAVRNSLCTEQDTNAMETEVE